MDEKQSHSFYLLETSQICHILFIDTTCW